MTDLSATFAVETVSRLKDRILELLGRQAPLSETTSAICLAYESLSPGAHCTMLIVQDRRLSVIAAPSLPESFSTAIDGFPIGPDSSGCGLAAHFGEPVICEDLCADPRLGDIATLAAAHGLKSCWSTPIKGPEGNVAATFAIYHTASRGPSAAERAVIQELGGLAAIAVERFLVDRRLVNALTAAQEAYAVRSAFLGVVSHELRTPLNAIIGFSEAMIAEIFGPLGHKRYGEYVGHIRDSGRMLLAIINDILDLSRIDADKLTLHLETSSASRILKACDVNLAGLAEKAGVDFAIEAANGDISLEVDPLRIKQVLMNLGSNAIKFTPRGGVVRIGGRITEEGGFEFAVSDTGIGMSPDEQRVALEPFRQVQNRFTKHYDGSGLGLPIARALVELHGGALILESARRKGTTVRVVLPPTCRPQRLETRIRDDKPGQAV